MEKQVSSKSVSSKVSTSETGLESEKQTKVSSWHQEKEQQLQGLNDRLAAYMEKVEELELENVAIQEAIENLKAQGTMTASELKTIYEDERAALRASLDEYHKESAELHKENERIQELYEKIQASERAKGALLEDKEQKLVELERLIAELRLKVTDVSGKLEVMARKWKQNEKRIFDLKTDISDVRKRLKAETMARVDLSNQNASIKEEYELSMNMSDRDSSLSTSKSLIDVESIEQMVKERCNVGFRQQLSQLRCENEEKRQALKQDNEQKIDKKISKERERYERIISATSSLQSKYDITKIQLDQANTECDALIARVTKLSSTVLDLERQIDHLQEANTFKATEQQKEIDRLNDVLSELQLKYDDLVQINLTLDQEICTFRKLVESGEQRLQVQRKRRKFDAETEEAEGKHTRFSVMSSVSTEGIVEIISASEDLVKLLSKQENPVSVSGWYLKWFDTSEPADEKSEPLAVFKFPRNAVINGEACVYSGNNAPRGAFRLKQPNWPSPHNPHVLILMDADDSIVSRLTTEYVHEDSGEQEESAEREKSCEKEEKQKKSLFAMFF